MLHAAPARPGLNTEHSLTSLSHLWEAHTSQAIHHGASVQLFVGNFSTDQSPSPSLGVAGVSVLGWSPSGLAGNTGGDIRSLDRL